MASLSKLYKVGDYMSRVEDGCKNLENFQMERKQLVDIARQDILTTYMEANSVLRRYYHAKEALAVLNAAINITTKNYFDITAITFGLTQPYLKRSTPEEFVAVQSPTSHTHLAEGRYWLWLQGSDQILVFQGSGITEASLNVWHIRYPDLSMFTIAAWTANTAFVDIPDGFVPYSIASAKVAAVKEKGMEVPADWNQQLQQAVSGVADRVIAGEALAEKLGKDVL
jgi:hypothetical protein